MNLDIVVNKYLLIWHLLYQSSVSDEIHDLKQRLWTLYKKEYSLVHADKDEILANLDDFIPNDDLIYNYTIKQSNTITCEYLKKLGFDARFCKICEGVNRYSEQERREPESDILELVDQFGGMLLDRPERIGLNPDEALVLLEHRNLKNEYNRYLESFREFAQTFDKVYIQGVVNTTVFARLQKLVRESKDVPEFVDKLSVDYSVTVDQKIVEVLKNTTVETENKSLFTNETKEKIIELSEIKKLVKYAVKYMKLDNVEFGIIFVNNKRIREINKEYRNIDRETDVITFRLADYEEVIYDRIMVLGDIYISLDKARSQSIEYGHSYLRELSFLVIHGFLHLLGYDHMNEEDEKIMFKLQEDILDGYGIKR